MQIEDEFLHCAEVAFCDAGFNWHLFSHRRSVSPEIFFGPEEPVVKLQFYFVRVHYLLIYLTCVFSSLNNVLILLCIIFLTQIYVLSVTVLTLWVAPPKMFCSWYRIYWSRNQLRNCTHFRHPTDEQLQHRYIFLATTTICSLSTLNSLVLKSWSFNMFLMWEKPRGMLSLMA